MSRSRFDDLLLFAGEGAASRRDSFGDGWSFEESIAALRMLLDAGHMSRMPVADVVAGPPYAPTKAQNMVKRIRAFFFVGRGKEILNRVGELGNKQAA